MSSSKRQNLKRTMSGAEGRRKRRETMISIRKRRKEDGYAARRNMAAAAIADQTAERSNVLKNLATRTKALLVAIARPDQATQSKSLRAFALLMTSGVPPLFDPNDPQYDGLWTNILQAIPSFISFLNGDADNIQMQSDATFALRFITSMDRSRSVIEAGALPRLVALLRSGIPDLQVQAAWTLGNIAAESPECCIEVHKECSYSHVLPYIMSPQTSLRRAAVWLLRSLFDHVEVVKKAGAIDLRAVKECVNVLTQLIIALANETTVSRDKKTNAPVAPWRMFEIKTGEEPPNDVAIVRFVEQQDSETIRVVDLDINFETGENQTFLAKLKDLKPLESVDDEPEEDDEDALDESSLTICDSLWALVEVAIAVDPASLQFMVDLGCLPALLKLLQSYTNSLLCSPALRLCEAIVSYSESFCQLALDSGLLSVMPQLLFNQSKIVREETCWCQSNISCGTADQVAYIVREPFLMKRLAEQLLWAEWDVRREALWVVCNTIVRADAAAMPGILELEVLDAFSMLLDDKEPEGCLLILEALDSILQRGMPDDDSPMLSVYRTKVEEVGCIDKIEDLCYVENDEICHAASLLLDTYFDDEDEELDVGAGSSVVVDAATSQSMFSFQPTQSTGSAVPFDFQGASNAN